MRSKQRTSLLDCLRVDRRSGGAGDDQRRAAEEEFVDAVALAVLGELVEIEDVAHAADDWCEHHPPLQRHIDQITTHGHGWLASVLSFGRTSTPQVSEQIAATCLSWHQ